MTSSDLDWEFNSLGDNVVNGTIKSFNGIGGTAEVINLLLAMNQGSTKQWVDPESTKALKIVVIVGVVMGKK